MPRKRVELEIKTPDEEEDKPARVGPLFALADQGTKRHVRTRVYREEPIDEGILPERVPPDADEDFIAKKYGGGTYRCEAVDEKGQYLAQKVIKISGEPKFTSTVARRRYHRWLQESGLAEPEATPAGDTTSPEDAKEARHLRELARIRAENEASIARIRAEAEAREAADERRRARDREDRRLEREAEEARRKAERDADREARAEERREAREADERRWATEMADRREARSERGDPMAQLAQMAQLLAALGLGGGNNEAPDAVTAIASRLPEVLQEIRNTGNAMNAADRSAQRRPKPNPAGGTLSLEGPIATRAQRAIEAIKRSGKDPEQVLARIFDTIAGSKPALPPKRPTPRRAAPTSKKSAPRRPPPRNGSGSKTPSGRWRAPGLTPPVAVQGRPAAVPRSTPDPAAPSPVQSTKPEEKTT